MDLENESPLLLPANCGGLSSDVKMLQT